MSSLRARLLSHIRRLVHHHPRTGALLRRLGRPLKPLLGLSPPGLAEDKDAYQVWLARQERLARQDERLIVQALGRLERKPRFLVLLTLDKTPPALLAETLTSLRTQLYPHWRAFLVAPRRLSHAARAELERVAAEDGRFQLRPLDVPAAARGEALLSLLLEAGAATKDAPLFLVPLAAGDLLARSALAETALTAALHPEARLIYGDEDRIDPRGRRHTPYFKPDFDPELMLAQNLLGAFAAYRSDLLAELGDLPPSADVLRPGAAHGVLLRAADLASPHIRHIPSILCHRRDAEPLGAAREAALSAAGRAAVQAFLAGKGVEAAVLPAPGFPSLHRIAYATPARLPRVSVIIPTRDRADLLRSCLEGLLGRTDYPDLEVWIIDNESREPETLALFAALAEDPRIRRLRIPGPFNYSRLNNLAAAATQGEFLLLLNNDIKVIGPGWLREMVALALRPGVGAVGAKLLYPDDTIQHAGVVLGMGWPEGVAGHFYCHAPARHVDPHGLLHVTRTVSAVTAACLLVRRSLYLEVGGFDEINLEVAFNDVDFCLRLAERGCRNLWTPHAELYHFESASRGKDVSVEKAQRLYREIAYMRQRWGGLLDADPYWNPNLALQDGMRRLSETPRHVPVWLEILGRAEARMWADCPAPPSPVCPSGGELGGRWNGRAPALRSGLPVTGDAPPWRGLPAARGSVGFSDLRGLFAGRDDGAVAGGGAGEGIAGGPGSPPPPRAEAGRAFSSGRMAGEGGGEAEAGRFRWRGGIPAFPSLKFLSFHSREFEKGSGVKAAFSAARFFGGGGEGKFLRRLRLLGKRRDR